MTSPAPAALDDTAANEAAVPQQPTTDDMDDHASVAGVVPPTRVPDAPAVAAGIEIGGRQGLDPTRYGDWELRGRCIDF